MYTIMWIYVGYDKNIYKSELASLLFDIIYSSKYMALAAWMILHNYVPFFYMLKVLGRRHNLYIKNDTVPIKRGSSVAERST